MDLTLGQLISIKDNFEKSLENKLLEMDVWFQRHLWDGSNNDQTQFITDEDFEAIQALTDKMKHMVLYIGCPSSIPGMIESIISRKIKRWQGNNTIETDDYIHYVYDKNINKSVRVSRKGFGKGKQLKNNSDIARVKKSRGYYGDEGIVLVGHFRWNNRGYVLSRLATDLLHEYYYHNF